MLEDILRRMAEHARENPSHGWNCACKNDMVREFRRILEAEAGLLDEFRLVALRLAR